MNTAKYSLHQEAARCWHRTKTSCLRAYAQRDNCATCYVATPKRVASHARRTFSRLDVADPKTLESVLSTYQNVHSVEKTIRKKQVVSHAHAMWFHWMPLRVVEVANFWIVEVANFATRSVRHIDVFKALPCAFDSVEVGEMSRGKAKSGSLFGSRDSWERAAERLLFRNSTRSEAGNVWSWCACQWANRLVVILSEGRDSRLKWQQLIAVRRREVRLSGPGRKHGGAFC